MTTTEQNISMTIKCKTIEIVTRLFKEFFQAKLSSFLNDNQCIINDMIKEIRWKYHCITTIEEDKEVLCLLDDYYFDLDLDDDVYQLCAVVWVSNIKQEDEYTQKHTRKRVVETIRYMFEKEIFQSYLPLFLADNSKNIDKIVQHFIQEEYQTLDKDINLINNICYQYIDIQDWLRQVSLTVSLFF